MEDERRSKTINDHRRDYGRHVLITRKKIDLFLFHQRLAKHVQSMVKTSNKAKWSKWSSTFPSSFSTANHRWEIKWNVSIVWRSRMMMYFKNHDDDEPCPLLSCQRRIQCNNPNDLNCNTFFWSTNVTRLLLWNGHDERVNGTTLQNCSMRISQRSNMCCILITIQNKMNLNYHWRNRVHCRWWCYFGFGPCIFSLTSKDNELIHISIGFVIIR